MFYEKSPQAFIWSAERLLSQYQQLYFWTWTFRTTPATDEHAMQDWNTFSARMQFHFQWLRGLRVCELHKSHGIHFHALVNGRIPVDRMRRIIHGTGRLVGHNRYLDFGRIHVRPCSEADAPYMAKYMTKQYRDDTWFGGRRRWGTIGGFKACKVNDIEMISPSTDNRRKLFGGAQVPYATQMAITMFTNWFGPVTEWPKQYVRHVGEQMRATNSNWLKHYEAIQVKLQTVVGHNPEAETYWRIEQGKVVFSTGFSGTARGGNEGGVCGEPWDGEAGNEPDYRGSFYGQPF